jgi:putative MATE family efflux protein
MSDTLEDYQVRGQEEKIDLTTKPILQTLVKLAWPVVATMFVHTAFLVTDMIWVGRLGASEMAAVISSAFFIWILFSSADIVTAGLVAIMARHYGAKRYDKASYAASQAIGFSLLLSVAISFIGYAFTPAFLRFIGTEPDVTQFGIEYLRIRFIGTVFLLWYQVGISIFRATGDTKTPLILSIIAVGGNIVLDPCLIFGLGPFPELGVAGAAIATVITMAMAVIGLVIYLIRGRLTLDLKLLELLKPDFKLIGQMVKIGLHIPEQDNRNVRNGGNRGSRHR